MWVEALSGIMAVFASVQVLSSKVWTNPLGLFNELIPNGREGKSKRAEKKMVRRKVSGE